MPAMAHDFDLAGLRLQSGEGRRLELTVPLPAVTLGGERYESRPENVPVQLEVSRMAGHGYALRLAFETALAGRCMRCLKDAAPEVAVDAREVDVPGGGEELDSPYLHGEVLDVASWARDSFVLAMPASVLCREDCLGLCPQCAADLNEVGEHSHEREPDPRWSKLRELELE
ncbi:MAG: YceD family protein [Solirubrobacteraceae bacterium]